MRSESPAHPIDDERNEGETKSKNTKFERNAGCVIRMLPEVPERPNPMPSGFALNHERLIGALLSSEELKPVRSPCIERRLPRLESA